MDGKKCFHFIVSVDESNISLAADGFGDNMLSAFTDFQSNILNNINGSCNEIPSNVIDVGQIKAIDDNSHQNVTSYAQYNDSTKRKYAESPANFRSNKNNLNGGGNKPASNGQIKFLNNLGKERNIDIESYVNNMFHKSLNELTGSEANMTIKKFKGN